MIKWDRIIKKEIACFVLYLVEGGCLLLYENCTKELLLFKL